MKKKLALLMAAIMTVAMVPMTTFASTKLTAVEEISTGVGEDYPFTSTVEITKENDTVEVPTSSTYNDGTTNVFDVTLKLTNGKFTEIDDATYDYQIEKDYATAKNYIRGVKVTNSTTATITLSADGFNSDSNICVLDISAYALEAGDVIATFSSNITQFTTKKVIIATAYDGDVTIESEGVVTFVEDSTTYKNLEDITITGLINNAIADSNGDAVITLKLKGNYEFCLGTESTKTATANCLMTVSNGSLIGLGFNNTGGAVSFLNDNGSVDLANTYLYKDKLVIALTGIDADQITQITISGVAIKATKSCEAGDVAIITVSGDNFDATAKLEVAKMVEEAVTYTVEDDDLPVIYAGKDYGVDDDNYDGTNTLKISIEENTGDILNTSRKATFTFPDGIEVVGVKIKGTPDIAGSSSSTYIDYDIDGYITIDENVVTIKNYSSIADEESDETDMSIEFVLNAAPTYEGDVEVTLGGEFDDVEFTVATVIAPYTIEAKTSEVLIDYRYVPVNEIVITEAEDEILKEGDVIMLEVEKMDFKDAGTYEVTEGDIEVDVEIITDDSDTAQLIITIEDESTEASTIVISGLELYLDRTLPVGGYALKNVMTFDESDGMADADGYNNTNILWENSTNMSDAEYDASGDITVYGYDANGLFKYSAVTVNDSYVEVVTAARDQDDSTTSRKIVITIGATTMIVGTETITLDAPAYINSEDYTMLPVRAISEAFGATVTWDDASKTVTVLSGQRIISMTIGSKTMYINGTPVAMNTAAEITNDRTFIPVRDLANSLGISAIDWNEASATVTLN